MYRDYHFSRFVPPNKFVAVQKVNLVIPKVGGHYVADMSVSEVKPVIYTNTCNNDYKLAVRTSAGSTSLLDDSRYFCYFQALDSVTSRRCQSPMSRLTGVPYLLRYHQSQRLSVCFFPLASFQAMHIVTAVSALSSSRCSEYAIQPSLHLSTAVAFFLKIHRFALLSVDVIRPSEKEIEREREREGDGVVHSEES